MWGKNHSKGDADSRLSKMRKTNPKIQKIAYTVLLVIGEGRMEREREKISLVIKCPNPSVNIFSCFVNYW